MTKALKISLAAITSLLIVTVVLTGFLIQGALQKNRSQLIEINARKEDLLSQQQKLSLMINDLNQTLQLEIKKNQELSAAQNTAPPVTQPDAAPTPPPAPAPVIQRPITRAS